MEWTVCILSHLFSAFLVGMYSHFAFDEPDYNYIDEKDKKKDSFWEKAEPSLPMYMTERPRYIIFKTLFILFAIAEWFLISRLLPILTGVEALLNIQGQNALLVCSGLAFISALLLLGLVQYLDWPRKLLFEYAREWFHQFACIPKQGRIVYNCLCFSSIDPDSPIAKKIIEALVADIKRGLSKADFELENKLTLAWKWARLSFAHYTIEEWNKNPLFSKQISEPSLHWGELNDKYIDTIQPIHQHQKGFLNEEDTLALNSRVEHLLANCHRLIACVVIMVGKSHKNPISYIGEAGYNVSTEEKLTDERNLIAKIVFAIIPTLLLTAFTFSFFHLTQGIALSVQSFISYFFSALIIMVLPVYLTKKIKRYFIAQVKQYSNFFAMPLEKYFAFSIFSWIIVTVLTMFYLHPDKLTDIETWKVMAFIGLIGGCFSFVTAYLTDIKTKTYTSRSTMIFGLSIGPLILGIITAGIVLAGMDLAGRTNGRLPYSIMGFSLAVVICFVLFYNKHKLEDKNSGKDNSEETITMMEEETSSRMVFIDKTENGSHEHHDNQLH